MIEQPMAAEFLNQTGRALLQAAHTASEGGIDVFVHVDGIPPLQVRKVEFDGDRPTFAAVHCWRAGGESEGVTWLVPLTAVRVVQIRGEWLT